MAFLDRSRENFCELGESQNPAGSKANILAFDGRTHQEL